MTTPTWRGRYRARTLTAALVACASVLLPVTPTSAEPVVHHSPGPGDEWRTYGTTWQHGHGGNFTINGLLWDDFIFLPLLSHYYASHRAYGDWFCYGDCATAPSTYVNQTYDAAQLFVHETWWSGQRLQYSTSWETTWYEDSTRAVSHGPSFIGPLREVHTYQQGTTDAHPLQHTPSCYDYISAPSYSVDCFGGGGLLGYHHAPVFRNETSVIGGDGLSYFGFGTGTFEWGWDGIA